MLQHRVTLTTTQETIAARGLMLRQVNKMSQCATPLRHTFGRVADQIAAPTATHGEYLEKKQF